MDLPQIITIFAIVATNLGTVIFLYCHGDNKMKEHRHETQAILQGIKDEMKDFHGRLCAIEERYRK